MRHFNALAILAVCLFCLPMAAQAAGSDSPGDLFTQLDADADGQVKSQEIPKGRQSLFARLIRTADKDGNGTLSRDEFAAGLKPQRKEKPIAQKAPGRLPGADELLLLLALLDKNADGRISPNEPPKYLERFYETLEDRIGSNDQGNIVLRQVARAAPQLSQVARVFVVRAGIDVELEYALLPEKNWAMVQRLDQPQQPIEALADPEQAMELFKRLDANGDGKVAYDEVPEQAAERFDRLARRADRDGDQLISEAEFRQFSARVRVFSRFQRARPAK